MPKTKKDLIIALADKVGGERGQRMREAFGSTMLKDLKAWDEVLSDEEFATQLKTLEQMAGGAPLFKKGGEAGQPGTWGLPN